MAKRPPFDQDDNNHASAGNAQVIALLNALGMRLIASEKERAELKEALADLEAKADQGERLFLTLQDRQSKIEAQAQAQLEKIEKAALLADRIEEAIGQQGRMNRRLDKMHQERVQMIRKLERIEETVIETQDALHSKALVLLTDQNVAGQSGKPSLAADGALPPAIKAANDDRPALFGGRVSLRLMATAAVVILGAFCGWAVYDLQKNNLDFRHYAALTGTETASGDKAATRTADVKSVAPAEHPALADIDPPQLTQGEEQNTDNDTDLAAAQDGLPIWREDDATLMARFDEDPDALAAALNAIEPAALPPVSAADAPAAGATEDVAALTRENDAQDIPVATPVIAKTDAFDDFIAGVRKDLPPLAQRIKPDGALPEGIKALEAKAFGGSSEAQHDLAAIYTAGHGGVKTDYARAAAWFTEAAIAGVANARYNLGVLYHQGLGVDKDLARAMGWYGAAAALGHPEAQYNLGIAHIEGIGTPYDPQAAATYFANAAQHGVMEAAYNLGLIHENGLLGAVRPEQALYWYKQAAEKGSPEAQAALDQLAKALGLSPRETEDYIGKAAAEQDALRTPQATPTTIRKSRLENKGAIETLRPEDKIDISEVARYIPPVTGDELAPASVAAAETNNIHAKNHATIAQIQEQLIRLRLYPGPADGLGGPQTEDAIRAYQMANSLPDDGRPSEALLLHLLTNELSDYDGAIGEVGSRIE